MSYCLSIHLMQEGVDAHLLSDKVECLVAEVLLGTVEVRVSEKILHLHEQCAESVSRAPSRSLCTRVHDCFIKEVNTELRITGMIRVNVMVERMIVALTRHD